MNWEERAVYLRDRKGKHHTEVARREQTEVGETREKWSKGLTLGTQEGLPGAETELRGRGTPGGANVSEGP